MNIGVCARSGCEQGVIALTCVYFPFFPDTGLYFIKKGEEGVKEVGREGRWKGRSR